MFFVTYWLHKLIVGTKLAWVHIACLCDNSYTYFPKFLMGYKHSANSKPKETNHLKSRSHIKSSRAQGSCTQVFEVKGDCAFLNCLSGWCQIKEKLFLPLIIRPKLCPALISGVFSLACIFYSIELWHGRLSLLELLIQSIEILIAFSNLFLSSLWINLSSVSSKF